MSEPASGLEPPLRYQPTDRREGKLYLTLPSVSRNHVSPRLTLFSYRLINLVPSARKGTTILFKEETLRQMPVFDYGSLRGVVRTFFP